MSGQCHSQWYTWICLCGDHGCSALIDTLIYVACLQIHARYSFLRTNVYAAGTLAGVPHPHARVRCTSIAYKHVHSLHAAVVSTLLS
eukprot:6214151-Pleurochrysis_carterae.AAC.5